MKILRDSSIFDSEKGTCWRSDPTFVGYGAGYPEQVELLNFTGRPSDTSIPCRMEVMLHATMQNRYYQHRTRQTQKVSFFCISSGRMYFQSNSSVLLAEPGDCVLLKPHCRNDFLYADERQCSYYEFILTGNMLDEFLRIYDLEQVFGLKLNDEKFFRKLFERMKNLTDVKPLSAIFPELTGVAFELLQRISSAVQIQARSSYVAEIRDFLEQRIKEKISMPEVAGRFKIDIHDMNRDFRGDALSIPETVPLAESSRNAAGRNAREGDFGRSRLSQRQNIFRGIPPVLRQIPARLPETPSRQVTAEKSARTIPNLYSFFMAQISPASYCDFHSFQVKY